MQCSVFAQVGDRTPVYRKKGGGVTITLAQPPTNQVAYTFGCTQSLHLQHVEEVLIQRAFGHLVIWSILIQVGGEGIVNPYW